MINKTDLLLTIPGDVFENESSYMLLPEGANGWLEGNIQDHHIILNREDLLAALVIGLRGYGYIQVGHSPIIIEVVDKYSYILEVPFMEQLVQGESGTVRFSLMQIKRAKDLL